MSKELLQCLDAFRRAQLSLNEYGPYCKVCKLASEFKKLAQELIFGGCLVVYSGNTIIRRIYLHTVEFYYHEEADGGLKDYIVYHKHKRKDQKVVHKVEYFKPGTINAHQSGIDITFENEDGQYRASALIRAFMVKEGADKTIPFKKDYYRPSKVSNDEVEYRSSYLYDYLFTNIPMPISVDWEPEKQSGELYQGYRVNVFTYGPKLDSDGNPAKNYKDVDKKPWSFSREQFPAKYQLEASDECVE